MSGRSPAGPLMHEHRVIERMLAVMRAEAASIASTGRTHTDLIDSVADFLHTFADQCHHGKEEDILFARLAEAQLDAQTAEAMRGLIDDHKHSRELTRRLAEANHRYACGDEAALADVESCLRALVELYPVHIAKEDRSFFKAAMGYLDDSEKARMIADFDEFGRTLLERKYFSVIEGLEQCQESQPG